jgi:cytochrome c55X
LIFINGSAHRQCNNSPECTRQTTMKRNNSVQWGPMKPMAWLAFALTCSSLFSLPAHAEAAATPAPERSAQLLHLLYHDCGSCHGLRLAGGLGPPLKPADLRGKPAENLRHVILYGRPGTAMPGWRAFLNESEAGWLVDVLMNGAADAD